MAVVEIGQRMDMRRVIGNPAIQVILVAGIPTTATQLSKKGVDLNRSKPDQGRGQKSSDEH
jgi:hypothetical protein